MNQFDHRKYQAFPRIAKHNRQWPDRCIEQAPTWCSVDLRDGNQALVEPMSVEQKMHFFELLVNTGFKQIEVGFPAASQQDYDFVRMLIEQDRVPADVTIQVLTQARDELIERSFAALVGARSAIVHLYNSTSIVQREQVFRTSRQAIVDIAVAGAKTVKACASQQPDTQWLFQYSPESFTGTELDYAVDVCNAVNAVWQPTPAQPVIINLPATVEMSTPNVYADQIEWFCEHVAQRDALIISLHTHNDRGCAIAAAELGVLAGADRIEGTLLGNGERTGNMDIVTMAMNLYSQGIDPQLDLSQMDDIIRTVQDCTGLPLHPRHPYAGELVFTAFSGSHQDAIAKCLQDYRPGDPWSIAYLPIDPCDLGRSYEALIRINSQSGKGGIAYIIEQESGIHMPRWMQIDFSKVVQRHVEQSATEVSANEIWQLFQQHYLQQDRPWQLLSYQLQRHHNGTEHVNLEMLQDGQRHFQIEQQGSGALEAFVSALRHVLPESPVIIEYTEHSLAPSNNAQAIAFVQLAYGGLRYCGAGCSSDIIEASMLAVLSALNQALRGEVTCTA
jgi:2-isopropylmalate synthase